MSTPTSDKKASQFDGLTANQSKLLLLGILCTSADGKIDYEKLSGLAKIKTSSAAVMWRGARQRLQQVVETNDENTNINTPTKPKPAAKSKPAVKRRKRAPSPSPSPSPKPSPEPKSEEEIAEDEATEEPDVKLEAPMTPEANMTGIKDVTSI